MTIFSPLLKTKISSFISALSIKLILSLFSNFRNFQPESHVCCKHSESEGGLVPSRNFYVRTRVNFTRANNREAMYGEYRVNVNVEPQSTLTFMHVFHTLPFFNARKIYVCTHVKIAQQWKSTLNASVNSSCAHPPTPPPPHSTGLLQGVCPPCQSRQSRGWGICKFCADRGLGICQTLGRS